MSKKLNLLILTGAVAVASAGGAATLTGRSLAESRVESGNSSLSASASDASTLLDQTIYVFTDASGKVRRTISSDWTRSLDTNKYTKVETTKKTPIELSVKYTLDGKEVSASEISGKSGRVTIEFNYNNTEKAGGYYVPYAVMTGMILDNEVFKNVEVSGGRIFNDGSRTVVAGVALPGMQENLNISEDTFNVPKSLKITADAKDFKLGMTMSLATTEIFDDIDTSSLDNLDDISSQISKLEDAMSQLMNGSSSLYDGIAELNDKSGILVEGINKLTAGSIELKNGLASADSGVDALQSGVSQLSDSLTSATTQYNDLLNQSASATFTSLLTGTHDAIQYQIQAGIMSSFIAKTTDSTTHTATLPPAVLTQMQGVLSAATMDALTANNYYSILTDYANNATLAGAGIMTTETKQTILATRDALARYQKEFIPGLAGYTGGMSQAAAALSEQILAGIDNLKTGTSQLASGATALSDGLTELNNSTPSLVSGISQLKDGSGQLRDGITQLNDEGIKKIVNTYGDIKSFADRLRDIANVAKNSNTKVKYIYRTDEIK